MPRERADHIRLTKSAGAGESAMQPGMQAARMQATQQTKTGTVRADDPDFPDKAQACRPAGELRDGGEKIIDGILGQHAAPEAFGQSARAVVVKVLFPERPGIVGLQPFEFGLKRAKPIRCAGRILQRFERAGKDVFHLHDSADLFH